MSATASVTAEQLVRALGRNNATLPAEIGTFLMFEGCESMLEGGPRELENLSFVRISEHGNVTLAGVGCDDETAARSLHRALTELLVAAGPALPPALARLSEQGPRGGKFSLRALHDELEAALVPLNRTASRRVLSRFAREAAQPLMEREDVDAALNSLIGGKAAPANDAGSVAPVQAPPPAPEPPPARKDDSFDGLDLGGEESHYLEASRPSRDRISHDDLPVVRASVRPSFAPQVTVPPKRRDDTRERELRSLRSLASDLHDQEPEGGGGRKLFLGFALVALAIIGVTVALSYRRERAETAVATPTLELAREPVAKRAGDLSVHVMLPNAQVLRYVGNAPVTVPNLPMGFAHEFVATAEGHKPSRVLVAADAQWESSAEGPRYETALQLAPLSNDKPMRDAELELGPSRLDAQSGAAPLRLGSVRVVASPHGARVYQLVGFSPDVRITDLPLDAPQEFLVYREGYLPKKLSVQESDFTSNQGRLSASYAVQLEKRTQ